MQLALSISKRERRERKHRSMQEPNIARCARAAVEKIAFVAILVFVGCKDQAKESASKAKAHATMLAELSARDVGEVERGLPEGAKRLASLYASGADARNDMTAVRAGLKRIRREVPDLTIAKSTFFALADDKGIAIRNDLEQDVMAGQNLFAVFPELAGAARGVWVTTAGTFPGPPGPAGPDRDFIAASPVKREDGSVAGILVTGWSYRYFARHLQESLLGELKADLLKAKDTGKLPIVYIAVFDSSGIFTAPFTPPVNEKALIDLKLVAKTAGGPYEGTLTITGREFGCAAIRAPKLGPETGIAILRSEI
jgi:hypothetical protein